MVMPVFLWIMKILHTVEIAMAPKIGIPFKRIICLLFNSDK